MRAFRTTVSLAPKYLSLALLNNEKKKNKQTKITRRKTDVHQRFRQRLRRTTAYNAFFRGQGAGGRCRRSTTERNAREDAAKTRWRQLLIGTFLGKRSPTGRALREHRVCPGSASLRCWRVYSKRVLRLAIFVV